MKIIIQISKIFEINQKKVGFTVLDAPANKFIIQLEAFLKKKI